MNLAHVRLTPRQKQVLERLRTGQSNKSIADGLGISVGTVKVHVLELRRRLGARNRTEAAVLGEAINAKTPAE